MKLLWEYLNLKESDLESANIDEVYYKLEKKNKYAFLAWKVLRDKYYSRVYRKYRDMNILQKAGFFIDKLNIKDCKKQNLYFLMTPYGKILDNLTEDMKNPIVLLSTGGFYPLHDGHINMMYLAKERLEKAGYDVVGGYFSPSHKSYANNKKLYNDIDPIRRVRLCQEKVANDKFLMVDMWESCFNKTYINFTEVITRLEKYLQKYVDKKIKVAYVFGGDNSEFSFCFEDCGIGVCINREGYESQFLDTKDKIKSKNIFFVENNHFSSSFHSQFAREKFLPQKKEDKYLGFYGIRNESIKPLFYLNSHSCDARKKEALNRFLYNLVHIFKSTFKHQFDFKIIDMASQLKIADKKLKCAGLSKTISLDNFYLGDFQLKIGRLFEVSDLQDSCLRLVERPFSLSLEKQLNQIEKGKYILVDDDSVSGQTVRKIKDLLKKHGITIEKEFFLSSVVEDKFYDVVDMRDFIVGAKEAGLIVRLNKELNCRMPYVFPYVNLNRRANIACEKEREFSLKIWKLNYKFYSDICPELKLKEVDQSFRIAMQIIGYNDEDKITQICLDHIKMLSITR